MCIYFRINVYRDSFGLPGNTVQHNIKGNVKFVQGRSLIAMKCQSEIACAEEFFSSVISSFFWKWKVWQIVTPLAVRFVTKCKLTWMDGAKPAEIGYWIKAFPNGIKHACLIWSISDDVTCDWSHWSAAWRVVLSILHQRIIVWTETNRFRKIKRSCLHCCVRHVSFEKWK